MTGNVDKDLERAVQLGGKIGHEPYDWSNLRIAFASGLGEAFQIGVPWHKGSDWDAYSLLYELFYSFISIHGGWEWSIPRKDDDTHVHSSYGHIRTAMQLIADGKITVPERLYELRDPRECDAVYHELSGSQDGVASVILDWRRFVTG